jgi:hypothetical protein
MDMMTKLGINPGQIAQVANPYQAKEIRDEIDDPENTILIFAVSEKDLPPVTLPLLPVGELEPTLLTLDAGAGIKEPDAVTDNCSELASVTGNMTRPPSIGLSSKSNGSSPS